MCVGGSASTNQISALLPASNYIIVYGRPNGVGGRSMTCWNPNGNVEVICAANQWTCKVCI